MATKKNIGNQFHGGLWLDSIPEQQPPDTYSFALNAIKETADYNSAGLSNEPSNELIAKIPEDFIPRGWLDLPDKNKFLIASFNPKKNISEIGFIDLLTNEYVKYFNDYEWSQKINFGLDKKIEFSFYIKGDCSETHVQFSACRTYYVVNIDMPFCDLTYDDIVLFSCECAGNLKTQVISKGGVNLIGGAYWATMRFTDVDNNYTNWFWVSNQSNLRTKNNAPGEVSRDSLRIEIPEMDSGNYDYIEIAVIRRVNGIYEVKQLPKISYSNKKQIYNLQSEQEFLLENLTFDAIFQKEIGWIRGDDIDSKEGHSILYNTYNNPNYDIQTVADRVRVRWVAYLCPVKEAHKYKTMPRNEVVPLGLRRNYCDGNFSVVGHLKGREATPSDLELVPNTDNRNCSLCDEPRWKVENTASVTKWYCGNPFEKSESSAIKPTWNILKDKPTVARSSETSESTQPRPGSVLQGHAITDTCSGTCTNHCGSVGSCCNGVCQDCKGTTGSGCSSCGNACSGGNCTQGNCPGGNCTGSGGIGGTGTGSGNPLEDLGITTQGVFGNCAVNITLYSNPDICAPCRTLESSGVLDQIAGALPKYSVAITKIKSYGPSQSMPEMYVECQGANFRIKNFSLSNITNAITNSCQCQDTYNCSTTGCTPAGANGEWSSYNECYANCPVEKEKKNKYSCDSVSGKCIQDDNGVYTDLMTCAKNCLVITTGDEQKYACISGKCTKDPSGTYDNLLLCQYNCESADTKRHTCTEEGCKESANGEYNNLSDCLVNCDVNGKGNGGGCGGNSGGCGGGSGCGGSGGCGGGGCGGTGCGSGCGDNGGGCSGGGCGGGCNGGSGGCGSCKNNGCPPTGCPEGGCDPKTADLRACPPGDPCAELQTYGANYPAEGMDIPGLISCLKLPCSDIVLKWLDLKFTVPWLHDSELDAKALLIRKRDGTVLDLTKTPVYYPPDIEFKKENYKEEKEEQPLTFRSKVSKWKCQLTGGSNPPTECKEIYDNFNQAGVYDTKPECVKNCSGTKQWYACVTDSVDGQKYCREGFYENDPSNPNTSPSYEDCIRNCDGVILNQGYECGSLYGVKTCIATGKGPYETVEKCLLNCNESDPNNEGDPNPHACIGGKCVRDPNGPYSSFNDCYRACSGTDEPRLNCSPVPIYDEKGCVVIGYDLPIFAEGEMGYWESEERYSMERKCNGDFMYGRDAGMPIRFFLLPSADILPTHISYQNGVPHKLDPGNLESNDTYVILLGLRIDNIEKLENEKVPGCKEAGWTIMMPELDSSNSRVIANGLAINTFLIDAHGTSMAVPNYGVNSLERFSPYNKIPADNSRIPHRGGQNNDTSSYVFFSPDTLYKEEPLNAHKVHAQLEIFGQGYQHGLYVEGEEPEGFFLQKENERGGRAAIHLNHYDRAYQREVLDPGSCLVYAHFGLTLFLKYSKREKRALGSWTFKTNFIAEADIASFNATITFTGISGSIILTEEKIIFTQAIDFSTQPRNKVYGKAVGQLVTNEGCIYNFSFETDGLLIPEPENEEWVDIQSSGGERVAASNRVEPRYRDNSITTCVKGAVYATGDSLMPKGDTFTYDLNNFYRERSVFFENYPDQDGNPIFYRLNNGIDSFLSDGRYNGHPGKVQQGLLDANNTCDGSFMGFAKYHNWYIFNAAGHYVSLLRYLPKQHGTLENIQYKELYTLNEVETICGQLVQPIGVNYIGQFSVKRHAFVTDRVGTDVARGGWIATALGIVNCGFVPIEGASNDPRNVDNMRPGDYWNGQEQFAGFTGIHKWYPNIQTTNVTFVVESKVNMHLPQLGNPEEPFNEVIYPELKGLNVDANFPAESNPRESWFNRYRWKMYEPSKFLRLLMILNTILKLVLMIYVIAMGTNISLTSVGAYAALTAAIILVLGYGYIITNERLAATFGYKDCKGEGEGGPDWGEMTGWHDLHELYNWDYSSDLIGRGIGIPLNYNLCPCFESLNGRVYWSSKQLVGSNGDAFRHFKINNFRQIPSNWGKMQRLIHWGNRIWFQTTDGKWNTNFGTLGVELTDSRFAQLGSGELIGEPYNIYGDIKEGFGGTLDPGAAITCLYGDFYIDRKARKIYRFTGQDEAISDLGVREFLQENLELYIKRDFPLFPTVSEGHSIGFSLGIDHRHNRLLISKVDYEALDPEKLILVGDLFYDKETNEIANYDDQRYWRNKSFTLSYFLPGNGNHWISFHSYIPSMYLWNRYNMFSFENNSLYKHGSNRNSFQTFYGKYYPFMVHFIGRGQGEIATLNFTYQKTRAVLKNLVWDTRSQSWRKVNNFFDFVGILNSYQSSGLKNVVIDSQDSKHKDRLIVTPAQLQYEFSELQNLVPSNKEVTDILEVCNGVLPNMLKDLAKFEKDSGHNYDRERDFYDEFIKYTFVKYDLNDSAVQMILRYVVTKVSIEHEDG